MKTLMQTRIYLALVAMCVTLTLVGPAAAQKLMPFHGAIQGEETALFNADQSIRTVDGSSTGRSTHPHLRRFTVQWGVTVIVATGRSTGHFTFQAANGDSISTELIGYGEAIFPQPGPPTHIHIVEHNIITGGTGRFTGATGSFTLDHVEVRQTQLLMDVNYRSDLEAGFALGQAVAQQALARATTDGADATWTDTVQGVVASFLRPHNANELPGLSTACMWTD